MVPNECKAIVYGKWRLLRINYAASEKSAIERTRKYFRLISDDVIAILRLHVYSAFFYYFLLSAISFASFAPLISPALFDIEFLSQLRSMRWIAAERKKT